MKKIGKKLCNFTKIFLVFGLLFSNLSSLKVVFAYEGDDISFDEVEVLDNDEKNIEFEEKTDTFEENDEEDEKKQVTDEEDEENKKQLTDEENEEDEEYFENEEDEEDEDEYSEEENDENLVVEGESSENDEEEEEQDGEEEVSESEEESEVNYTEKLNNSATTLGLNKDYLFKDINDGKKLYVVVGVNDAEVENIISNAFDYITFEIAGEELTLIDGDTTVTYGIVIYDEEFLNKLIKNVVGSDTTELEDSDVDGNGTTDVYDVVLLKNIIDNGFGVEVVKQNVTISSKFDGNTTDLTVGDTFTVQYVLTLSEYAVDGITGLINYNKDMLSLDKVEVRNFETGDNYEGKFLYLGDYLRGTEKVTVDDDGNELTVYGPTDYVVVIMTFTAIESGNDTLSIDDIGYFYENIYYEGNESLSTDVSVISNDSSLSSLSIAGNEIELEDGVYEYSLTVPNDVVNVDLEYVLSSLAASVISIVAPEELAVGENTITITVKAENGEEKTYTITVTREGETEEEETVEDAVVAPVNYQENNYNNDNNKNDDKKEIVDDKDKKEEEKDESKDEGRLSRIIIVILILLAIAGLIYLIFKDDDDDETKKANKEINKLKKEELKETESKKVDSDKKTNKKGR